MENIEVMTAADKKVLKEILDADSSLLKANEKAKKEKAECINSFAELKKAAVSKAKAEADKKIAAKKESNEKLLAKTEEKLKNENEETIKKLKDTFNKNGEKYLNEILSNVTAVK